MELHIFSLVLTNDVIISTDSIPTTAFVAYPPYLSVRIIFSPFLALPFLSLFRRTFGQSRDATKRSINLALSHRGQAALASVGLLDSVMAHTIEMPQRAIHHVDGTIITQQYGRPGQAIYSVGRSLINRALLDELDKLTSVHMYFEANVTNIDNKGVFTVKLKDNTVRTYLPRLIVGADGAYSAVRNFVLRHSRTDFHRHFIEHGYKELTIPSTITGNFALPEPNSLHIWPRKKFMLIALPNPDRSFTATLFMPFTEFNKLDNDNSTVRPFFQHYFPDTVPLFPELEKQFATNPTSSLVEIRVKPWSFEERVVLIGDAAHSTVPFYGQGMNAALEDCTFFGECLESTRGDIPAAVRKYDTERQPAGEALCDLSMGNYDEMKDKTASSWFLLRKRLEGIINSIVPQYWIPQYSMVAFTRIPYHEVIKRANKQDQILDIALGGILLSTVGIGIYTVNRLFGNNHNGISMTNVTKTLNTLWYGGSK